MEFGDEEFNQKLASVISHIEEANQEFEKLNKRGKRKAMVNLVINTYFEKFVMNQSGGANMGTKEFTDLLIDLQDGMIKKMSEDELEILCANFRKQNAVALRCLDQLLAGAKDKT